MMAERSPFEFDMRVAADKKRRKTGRRGMSGAQDTSNRGCDFNGCKEPGQYRAPQSPERLDDYFWFCKEHAREYNLKWNFFQGTTDAEFQAFLDKDRLWGRATEPFGKQGVEARAWQRLGVDDPIEILGERATQNPGRGPAAAAATRKLPATERKALEILDARDTWTRTEIRKQYKSLVKDLHPDMNGGDRSDEDRLQEVVWAWDQIKESRYFRE
jgi:DnaJ domain